jgi:hypothetical protein
LGATFGFAAGFGFAAALGAFALGAALGLAAAVVFLLAAAFFGLAAAAFFSVLGFGAAFAAAGLGSFFASLVPPELPVEELESVYRQLADAARTFWLSEDSLVDTRLESSVEEGVEHVVGSGNLVVGLDVLLEGDAAIRKSTKCSMYTNDASSRSFELAEMMECVRTLIHYAEM